MVELLAKSRREGRALTLEQHLADTDEAARVLFAEGRLGTALARFFRLDPSDTDRLVLHVRIAGLFHDIGKANEGFQALVEGTGRQLVRHEHLSALVLCLPSVREWLAGNASIDRDALVAAVLSHHLDAAEDDKGAHGPTRWGTCKGRVRLHFGHPQVRAALARVGSLAGLRPPPDLRSDDYLDSGPWAEVLNAGRKWAIEFSRKWRGDADAPTEHKLALATKVGLVAADSLASATFRTGIDMAAWVDATAKQAVVTQGEVAAVITEQRLQIVGAKQGVVVSLDRFQEASAALPERALIVAGCGTGKTLAAWNWIGGVAERRPIGRVFFLYPTRGTATEGYRDYVGLAPEGEGRLVTGTAQYEIAAMQANPPEGLAGKNLLSEDQERMFALGIWGARYVSATVNQLLGFLDHVYGPTCLVPILADSAVVFDEVHSYNPRMFGRLLDFLRYFDVAALCMTATLPADRERQLASVLGAERFPPPGRFEDLDLQQAHPRYRVRRATLDGALEVALQAWRAGGRVLWVVNRVAECQRLARELGTTHGVERVVCYHSRFRLCDRTTSHTRAVAEFQQRARPAFAVTTQVCEMSLDLDADVLITEEAPVTSLVQRFGRCNRGRRERGDGRRGDIQVYPPSDRLPYSEEDLRGVPSFLDEVVGERSQVELALAVERHGPREARAAARTAPFLVEGYYASPGPGFRDIEPFTRSAILAEDAPLVAGWDPAERRQRLAGLVMPAPRKYWSKERAVPTGVPRWLEMVDRGRYSPEYGLEDST